MSLPSFFPLCTIVPAVSAGAVVQTFRKQQGQLCKVKKGGQTPSYAKWGQTHNYLVFVFILG